MSWQDWNALPQDGDATDTADDEPLEDEDEIEDEDHDAVDSTDAESAD